jgi:polyisoprenoid-binding protein YceI
MSSATRSQRRSLRGPALVIVAVLVIGAVAVGAYGIWYLFLQGPGPAAVGSSPAAIPSANANASLATTDGTWNVDTSIGSFSDFSSSFVGYRVQEQLASIGANTAVGRTPDVQGSLTLQGSTVSAVDVTANLQSLQSNDSRRDGQLSHQGIQTSQFPTATFTLTQPISLGSIPANGQTVTVNATGNLTLHGVTKEVQIPLKVTLSGDVAEVTGSTNIAFADYNITPPSSFAVLSVDDHGVMELQLFFKHA